jgi:hypothetical protein
LPAHFDAFISHVGGFFFSVQAMSGPPLGYTGVLVMNQGGANNEKKHPGWNQQKWEDLTTHKVSIVLCQEWSEPLVAGRDDSQWITVSRDYLAARGYKKTISEIVLLDHEVCAPMWRPLLGMSLVFRQIAA